MAFRCGISRAGSGSLGTPDHATVGWRVIEPLYGFFAPGGYKDEHITHYTKASLAELATRYGFETVGHEYVFRSELVLALRKVPRGEARVVSEPAAEPLPYDLPRAEMSLIAGGACCGPRCFLLRGGRLC